MFNFTGTSSHQILCYLDVHLQGRQINTVVIHLGINNILRDRSQSNIDRLFQKIMSLKCKKYGVKNIFFLGLLQDKHCYSGKNSCHVSKFCQKYGWFYVYNKYIGGKHLYKDILHLIEGGKIILTRNL